MASRKQGQRHCSPPHTHTVLFHLAAEALQWTVRRPKELESVPGSWLTWRKQSHKVVYEILGSPTSVGTWIWLYLAYHRLWELAQTDLYLLRSQPDHCVQSGHICIALQWLCKLNPETTTHRKLSKNTHSFHRLQLGLSSFNSSKESLLQFSLYLFFMGFAQHLNFALMLLISFQNFMAIINYYCPSFFTLHVGNQSLIW